MENHHKPECLVKRFDCYVQGQGHERSERKKIHEYSSGRYPKNYWPFWIKLDMVMHHHEPKCHLKRLICYHQGQGRHGGSYDENRTVSTISTELFSQTKYEQGGHILTIQLWFTVSLGHNARYFATNFVYISSKVSDTVTLSLLVRWRT